MSKALNNVAMIGPDRTVSTLNSNMLRHVSVDDVLFEL